MINRYCILLVSCFFALSCSNSQSIGYIKEKTQEWNTQVVEDFIVEQVKINSKKIEIEFNTYCEKCMEDYENILASNLIYKLVYKDEITKRDTFVISFNYLDKEKEASEILYSERLFYGDELESLEKIMINKNVYKLSNYICSNVSYEESYLLSQGLKALRSNFKLDIEDNEGLNYLYKYAIRKEIYSNHNNTREEFRKVTNRLVEMFDKTGYTESANTVRNILDIIQ